MHAQVLLGILLVLQLAMAWWSVCRTANDKIDGFEKGFTSLLEAVSSCLVLAGSILAEQWRQIQEETGEEDLQLLSQVLRLANCSSQVLMAAVFLPMAITTYNSMLVPIVGHVWQSNGSMGEIACQMAMTLILLPYEVATTFLGCKGAGIAADVVGDMETTAVELAAPSADLSTKFDADGSGRVSKDEFATAVAAVGFDAPRAVLDAIFEQVDSDDSGDVSARELKATLEEGRRVREQEELEAELEEADVTLVHARDELKQGLMGALSRIAEIFEASDTDGSGMIDANEFCKAVAALGLTASRETCAAVFSHYDADGSGQMAYTEFMLSALRDALAVAATQVGNQIDQATNAQRVTQGADSADGDGGEGGDGHERHEEQKEEEIEDAAKEGTMPASNGALPSAGGSADVARAPEHTPKARRHVAASAAAPATRAPSSASRLTTFLRSQAVEKRPAVQLAAPSKGKLWRLKRAVFLARVRGRRAEKQAASTVAPELHKHAFMMHREGPTASLGERPGDSPTSTKDRTT